MFISDRTWDILMFDIGVLKSLNLLREDEKKRNFTKIERQLKLAIKT